MPRVIGVDESGKGDFFGPLVIAACLASDEDLPVLREFGARDSKTISDTRLAVIDTQLRERFPHALEIILPSDYNRTYARVRNLNLLLADGHARVICRLNQEHPADLAISDKFGKPELVEQALRAQRCDIALRQLTGGEAILQVAAASIIARAAFLRELANLSATFACELPKGAAAHVDAAGRMFVKQHGAEALTRVAKVHFKNYARATRLIAR